MDYKIQLKKRFKEVRIALKKSQSEFADALKMKQGNVSQIELEDTDRGVPEKAILLLEKLYNINPVWFETGEGEMFKNKDLDDQQPGRLSEHISTYGVKDKPEPARAYDLKDKVIDNLLEQLELLKKELAEMKAKETKD